MNYDETEFYKRIYTFEQWEKFIKRKNASQDHKISALRKQKIIEAYNEIIKYTKDIFKSNDTELRTQIRARLVNIRDRVITCLTILGTNTKVPTDFTKYITIGTNSKTENTIEIDTMGEQSTYVNNISRILNYKYSGDPNALQSFITAIELADTLSTEEQQPILTKYIKTKLEGKALEAIPETATNATQIIQALKNKIKVETSKVVLGKFLALRAERNGLQKFVEEADELANALRRAYISEGMSTSLAETTTIDKTVDMCRLSARTPLVKSVLASTHFNDPKEVVAKLITESARETTETQILYYSRNNTRGRGKRNNDYQNNQYRNNRGNNFRNGRGYYNNSNNRNDHSNGNNYTNGYRGRGRGNYSNNFNRRGNNQNRRENERYVRMIDTENDQTPSSQRGTENVTIHSRSN